MTTVQFTFRPIERWPQEPTPAYKRKGGTFKVTHDKLLADLSRELSHLGVSRAYIQADVEEKDIRISDGQLRSSASPKTPRVIIAAQTKHGPLQMACDTYSHWKANMRAITLSLAALRAVTRYGVLKTGEQYRGLKQLASGSGPINSDEAATFIAAVIGNAFTKSAILMSPQVYSQAYRAAVRKLHPDANGGAHSEAWHHLDAAKAILDNKHGQA